MDNTISEDEQINKFKEIYEDKELKLPSGNVYKFTELNHKKRLKVFTRFQSLQKLELMFFDSNEFEIVQNIIDNCVVFDGMQLSKLPNHWDKNTSEMITFYTHAMGAISYPFFAGGM